MAQPMADGREVNTGLEQVNCCAMPQGMWMESLAGKARHRDRRQLDILSEDVTYAVARERAAAMVAEERLGVIQVDALLLAVGFVL